MLRVILDFGCILCYVAIMMLYSSKFMMLVTYYCDIPLTGRLWQFTFKLTSQHVVVLLA